MKNIMKAQLYQLVRQRNLRSACLGFFALAVFFGIVPKLNNEDITAGEYFAGEVMPTCCMMAQFLAAIMTAYICADDFGDKTANYELLSGTLRRDAFFGKAIPSIIISTAAFFAFILVTMLTDMISYGWGNAISPATVLFRAFLMLFSVIRLNCFYIFISFLTKRLIAVPAISYIHLSAVSLLSMFGGAKSTVLLGSASLNRICAFDSWYTFGLDDDNIHIVYETALTSEETAEFIIVPIIFSAVYLILGYVFFRSDDIE